MKRTLLVAAVVLLTACGGHQVTVENTSQGKVAVYATKVIDGTKAITDAVKQLEASGVIPTAEAAAVVRTAVTIDKSGQQLADALQAYAVLTPSSAQAQSKLDEISGILNAIGAAVNNMLVPISNTEARTKIAQLVGALNQTVLTISIELAKGVHPATGGSGGVVLTPHFAR